mgnify:CR=1 FL=1
MSSRSYPREYYQVYRGTLCVNDYECDGYYYFIHTFSTILYILYFLLYSSGVISLSNGLCFVERIPVIIGTILHNVDNKFIRFLDYFRLCSIQSTLSFRHCEHIVPAIVPSNLDLETSL